MNSTELRKIVFEKIKNNEEWKNDNLSEVSLDKIFGFKKGNNELVVETNIDNENQILFKYNNEILEDDEILYLFDKKQLIDILSENINWFLNTVLFLKDERIVWHLPLWLYDSIIHFYIKKFNINLLMK